MNHRTNIPTAIGLAFAIAAVFVSPLHADPPGPPPGPPGDTMKSLQEIWDKIGALEAQNVALLQQLGALTATPGSGFPMEFVHVLDAGNAEDPLNSGSFPGIGAVDYAYRIGKYEVTNAQYAQFLNAVAATDTNFLFGGGEIARSGGSGSYTYAAKPAMGDKPVIDVNWYEAARFCNWLHNGQPSGAQDNTTTEDGAYTLTNSFTVTLPGSDPVHGANGRNAGAKYYLPNDSEWYKAAYHQPAEQGGDADNYWLYPTRSNTPPTVATADATGNIDNDAANIANYDFGADWNGEDGNVTTVGSGGVGSASYYGAFDMGGNVWEWNEELVTASNRGIRGSSRRNDSDLMQSSYRSDNINPITAHDVVGFRVAAP